MSLPISNAISIALKNIVKEPQLILEIEGLPSFSSTPVSKYAVYNDPIVYGQPGLYYGTSLIIDENISAYIDFSKTTQQITQQLLVDKGGSNSTTSFDVALIDKDEELTRAITPAEVIDEILAKKARMYLVLEGAGHPQDSLLFFSGIVAGVKSGSGYVKFTLTSSEKLKNLDLFPKISAETTLLVNSGDTTITVDSTDNFILPADSGTLRTYLTIGDEIIEYTGKTATTFTGCVRGQFNTIAASHSIGSNIESAYRLQGTLKDLSLKLMLSGKNTDYLKNEPILSTNNYGDFSVPNAVFLAKYNIDQLVGVVSGDIATITGGVNAGTYTVLSFFNTLLGSYLILSGTLVNEGSGVATLSLKSKYAVLPSFCGLEMTPDQVDVAEFEAKDTQFSSSFFNYDFLIKDDVNGSEFINTQILFPSGAYSLSRKTRTSLGLTIPPLAQSNIKKLDDTNVIKASSIMLDRSISSNFYNAVVYKYEKDQVDDKFTKGKIRQSASSTNRIKVANKAFTIEADGVRAETNFSDKFNIVTRRFLDRYQFAAESMQVSVDFGTGFDIELGDTVILDGRNLNITDTKDQNATRVFQPRLFEVQNKIMNIKGNPIVLTLVDTGFNLDGRYGIVSPSSIIDAGSTTTNLKLKKSYGFALTTATEGSKYRNYVGFKFKIRSYDHTFSETRIIAQVDPTNDNAVILDSPLSMAPSDGYILEVANYSTSVDPEDQALIKTVFVSRNNQVTIVTGISNTQFTVSLSDVADLAVGNIVMVHDDNYNNVSNEVLITDVTGTIVTVSASLGFTPSSGNKAEFLGYPDAGKPYRFI